MAEGSKINHAVVSSLAGDLASRFDQDFVVILIGNFYQDMPDITIGCHHRVPNPEQSIALKLQAGVEFLQRLLSGADGDQLPEGLVEAINQIAVLTNVER